MLRFENDSTGFIPVNAYEIIDGDIMVNEDYDGSIEDVMWDIYRDYPDYENCGNSGRFHDKTWYVLTMINTELEDVEVNLYW